MILFTILTLTAIMLVLLAVAIVSIFGAGILIAFGDVILCVIIIGWLIKKLFSRKDK